MHFVSMRATFPAHLIHLDFINLIILVKSTNYAAPHYAVFSVLLSVHPSQIQTFSSAPCSQTPSMYVLTFGTETKFQTHTEQVRLYFGTF
jgi:hypothetical protein